MLERTGWVTQCATRGQKNRWGPQPYACQTLGTVSLFDFSLRSVKSITATMERWLQFLVQFEPLTVLIGLDEKSLPGTLVRYPGNRDCTPKTSKSVF